MSTIAPIQPAVPASHATAHPVPTEERAHELRVEQIVRATVAEGGQDEVMLELAGHRLRAETRVPLKAGQRLDLMVTALSPRVELRIVEDLLTQRLGQTLHLLGGRWDLLPPVRDLLAGPDPLFDRLSPSAKVGMELWLVLQGLAAEHLDGKVLRQLARNLGLDFEARLARGEQEEVLATLKGALLEVLGKMEGEGRGRPDVLGPLQALELFQFCQLRLLTAHLQLIPLPLPFLEQGYLLADRQRDGEEGRPEPFRLSLHALMEGLGALQVDFLQDEQGLYIRFLGETQEKTDFLSAHADEVRSLFGEKLKGLSFARGAQNPATTLVKLVSPEGRGILDTRI